jgi:hypothetical protein
MEKGEDFEVGKCLGCVSEICQLEVEFSLAYQVNTGKDRTACRALVVTLATMDTEVITGSATRSKVILALYHACSDRTISRKDLKPLSDLNLFHLKNSTGLNLTIRLTVTSGVSATHQQEIRLHLPTGLLNEPRM